MASFTPKESDEDYTLDSNQTFVEHMGPSAEFSRSSSPASSRRFSSSVHSIPSPPDTKSFKPYTYLILHLVFAIGTPLIIGLFGIGLEVALALSEKRGGFRTISLPGLFQNVSGQFIASFLPTLIIIPFAVLWRELDWCVRAYQPYLSLQRGNVNAEEGLLLDYIDQGPVFSLFRARKYKHYIVFWSCLTALFTYAYQPLAGSVFQIVSLPQTDLINLTITGTISLSPDVDDLNVFVAAAGYADAAVIYTLPDPPYVSDTWSIAGFALPHAQTENGTVVFNTTGVETVVNCANPVEDPIMTKISGSLFNLSSKSVEGCIHSVTFNSSAANEQYGVEDVDCLNNASADVQFRSVMFWFLQTGNGNKQEAKTIFCSPQISLFETTMTYNLDTKSFTHVNIQNPYLPTNNVTGGTLAGKAFNGLIFPDNPNPFIQQRANTIKSTVPEAIFRAATQVENGPQATFDLANGFLDLTSKVYTQHLAVAGRSIYFVSLNTTSSGVVTSLVPRIWLNSFPTHALSIILILTAFIGTYLQLLHRRQRLRLLLATPPGSIASITALTSQSGFGHLLNPFDDAATLEKKLDGLRFRLDKRTGAIIAEEYTEHEHNAEFPLLSMHTKEFFPNERDTDQVSSIGSYSTNFITPISPAPSAGRLSNLFSPTERRSPSRQQALLPTSPSSTTAFLTAMMGYEPLKVPSSIP